VALPKVPALPKGGTVFPKGTSAGGVTIAGIPGNIYSYLSAAGAPQLVPAGSVAAPGFDSSRYFGTSSGSSGSAGGNAASGGGSDSSGGAGSGVSVPVYPQQGAKPVSGLATDSAQQPLRSGSPQSFPALALAAVLVLGAATAALVRTYRASRAHRCERALLPPTARTLAAGPCRRASLVSPRILWTAGSGVRGRW
jgi:hypothetical protein